MTGIVVRNPRSRKSPRLIRLPEHLGDELMWGDDKCSYVVFASQAEAIRGLKEMKDMGGYCPSLESLEFLPAPSEESELVSSVAVELENVSALLEAEEA